MLPPVLLPSRMQVRLNVIGADRFEPNPTEVECVLVASLDDLQAAYEKRRLVRRGVPIKTDTYLVADKMIWGATARILAMLFERLNA